MSFSDKVVIVTGSSSGIGAAIAVKFAEEGAQVVIHGRNGEKLRNVSEQCASLGCAPLIVLGDVSIEEEARRIVDDTVNAFGKIDVLVNNAGIIRITPVLSGRLLETFDEVVNTNLRPVVNLTALAAPYLVASSGNIVNISSVAASTVTSGMSCYDLSKAAINHFTRSIALELASSGVRVNSISPGPVMTDILTNNGVSVEEISECRQWQTPLGRMSTPDEVANLALYLASEKAVGITGSDFVVDNGIRLM